MRAQTAPVALGESRWRSTTSTRMPNRTATTRCMQQVARIFLIRPTGWSSVLSATARAPLRRQRSSTQRQMDVTGAHLPATPVEKRKAMINQPWTTRRRASSIEDAARPRSMISLISEAGTCRVRSTSSRVLTRISRGTGTSRRHR